MRETADRVTLFQDDFSAYPPGERLDAAYFRALEGAPGKAGGPIGASRMEALGPWRQTTLHYSWRSERIKGHRDCALPWRLIDLDGRRWLAQPESFFNVMLVAGSPEWRDYALELDVVVGTGPAGPVVRYQTSRMNYWVRLEAGQPVMLVRRTQDEHVMLGTAPGCIIERDRVYRCAVECEGYRIAVSIDGHPVLHVDDHEYGHGCIALRTEGPSRFADVRVTAERDEVSAFETRTRRREASVSSARLWYPKAKLLREVELPAWANEVHLRDVNGDGRPEIVACEVVVPVTDYIMLSRMSCLDWEGRELWSFGEPKEGKFQVHGAFAFNVADIDGDDRPEILATSNFEMLAIDGATGKVKRRAATPRSYMGREDRFPRTVGDSILVCNLRGLEAPRDFILKDRYRNLWAYTYDFRPLWHRHLNTGHYPRACDIDGDGADEVMAGYSLLNSDGSTRWVVPGGDPERNIARGAEHMDACLIERFGAGPEAPLQIAMAASDLGFLLMDIDGTLRAHHKVGHAQRLGAAPFRPDLPGRQFVVQTFWGNRNILNLFDCEGRLLLIKETDLAGVQPVNWRGDGRALILGARWLLDGNFDPVVELPGGGAVSPRAYDLNGDGVDEIALRQGNTLRLYGPHQAPATAVRLARRGLTNWNTYGGFYL